MTRRLFRNAAAGLVAGTLALIAASAGYAGPVVEDAAGRAIALPDRVERVFPAGPPAAIMLYSLAPEKLMGWPRAMRPDEAAFLPSDHVALPTLGRLTGRGNTTPLEAVVAMRPDLIIDVGSTDATYVALAERVQGQLKVPYALLDGRFAQTAETYRRLGRMVGAEARAEELARHVEATLAEIAGRVARVPPAERPRVYYARGPRGLETGLGGSINVETIEFLGARNVAAETTGGLAAVSLEQVLRWDPAIIVTVDERFAASVGKEPAWRAVRAVREGRVHLVPGLPFGWVDFPPAVNRLIGLRWLARLLYPALFPEDLRLQTAEFYQRFYHRAPSAAQLDQLLGALGR